MILRQDPQGTSEALWANNDAGNNDNGTSEDSDASLLLQAPNEALLVPEPHTASSGQSLPVLGAGKKREPIHLGIRLHPVGRTLEKHKGGRCGAEER